MRRNRRHDRAGDPPIQAIYTMADANAALDLIQTQPQETPFTAAPGFEAVLWNAGHILGSSSVELRCGGSRLLFSGDLGPAHKAFEPDPVGPAGLDHVFCESTYGDRDHPPANESRDQLLAHILRVCVERRGKLIIPAFADWCTVDIAGAGGSLRAGVTDNPVLLTRAIKRALVNVTCGGAPAYVWPGGGITVMVDALRMPASSFGTVPTPAIVAPIEFSMRLDDYQRLGGHMAYVRPMAQVLATGGWHADGAPTARRIADAAPANPWPLGRPPLLG